MKEDLTTTRYQNPIVDDDFPDPVIIYVEGKGYYAYATHDEFSPTINNILVRQSPDLVHWSPAQGALLAPPAWAKESRRFWCPHVVEVNGEFRLYYATQPDHDAGMCLALATSDRPVDFIDCGQPILQKAGSSYEMIDPCLFIDPISQKHLLYYGSAHQPIRVVELAADGLTIIAGPTDVLYPADTTFNRLREGAFVTYNREFKRYFLWVSGDNTWAEKSYAVSVFWSDDPLAVFRQIPDHHLLIQPNETWDSPGHNCIIQDALGQEWIYYHAVDTIDRYIPGTDRFRRKMCMEQVFYTAAGWPYVKGSSPSRQEQEGPVVRQLLTA